MSEPWLGLPTGPAAAELSNFVGDTIFDDLSTFSVRRSIRSDNVAYQDPRVNFRHLAALFGDDAFIVGWMRQHPWVPILTHRRGRGFDIVVAVGADVDWTCWELTVAEFEATIGDIAGVDLRQRVNPPGLIVGLRHGWVQFSDMNAESLWLYPPPPPSIVDLRALTARALAENRTRSG